MRLTPAEQLLGEIVDSFGSLSSITAPPGPDEPLEDTGTGDTPAATATPETPVPGCALCRKSKETGT